jgi:hypothetical protein
MRIFIRMDIINILIQKRKDWKKKKQEPAQFCGFFTTKTEEICFE